MAKKWMQLVLLLGVPAVAPGQTHAVKKPENVVRALAVYEWTGDQAKPTASRVVPVSLYINGELRDGGVYLANPVPFVLDSGTIFELERAGVGTGTLELSLASQMTQGAAADIEDVDSWVGYGVFKPKPSEAPTAAASKKSGPLPQVVSSGGKGPHFSNKPAAADPADADEKRTPVDHSSAAGGTVSAAGADRSADESGKDDAERPTLRRRTPVQEKAEAKKKDQASVSGVGSLNDDPDRPVLGRGRPGGGPNDLPPLLGLPADMHQAVGVSDARDREEHPFERPWESPAERGQVLSAMQALARAKVALYRQPPSPSTGVAAKTTAPRPRTRGSVGGVARGAQSAGAVAAEAWTEERLAGYTLSYGGTATYVYTAALPGVEPKSIYVAVIAQQETGGPLQQAFASVTDSSHLDRTPQVRLVDAVDAEASNRASLLLELRAANTRQFALYRVIGAQADQTFSTGTIPEQK